MAYYCNCNGPICISSHNFMYKYPRIMNEDQSDPSSILYNKQRTMAMLIMQNTSNTEENSQLKTQVITGQDGQED